MTETVKNKIHSTDFARIGRFGAVMAAIEVVFGSILLGMRIPIGGYILSFVQNFLLIQFGKRLEHKTRIFWISFISAAFKSLSPAGGKFKPMFAIFMQGLMFQLPVTVMGWNFLSVLTGSLLLGLWTMIHDLLFQYIKYGGNVIVIYLAISKFLETKFALTIDNQLAVIIAIISLRLFVGVLIAILGFFMDFTLFHEESNTSGDPKPQHSGINLLGINISLKRESWKENLRLSTRDLARPVFLLPLFIMTALCVFAGIDRFDIYVMIIRFIAVSWIFLVVARWIDFAKITTFLRNRGYTNCALAFETAFLQFPEEVNRYKESFKNRFK